MSDSLAKSPGGSSLEKQAFKQQIIVKKYNGECLATFISNITTSNISANKSHLRQIRTFEEQLGET